MKKLAAFLALSLLTGAAWAESRITAVPSTTTSLSATARLNFAVNVPRVLYLRVGDAGATINTVNFNVGLSGSLATLPVSDQVFSGALPPALGTITATDNNGASDGQVAVQLWTNNGTANLTCSGAALTAGAATIPLSDITVTSTVGGTLGHPGANLGCTAAARGSAGGEQPGRRVDLRIRAQCAAGGRQLHDASDLHGLAALSGRLLVGWPLCSGTPAGPVARLR